MPRQEESDHEGELHVPSSHAGPADRPQHGVEATEHEGAEQAPAERRRVCGDDGVHEDRHDQQGQGGQPDAVRQSVRADVDHGQHDADPEEGAVHETEEGETGVHPGRVGRSGTVRSALWTTHGTMSDVRTSVSRVTCFIRTYLRGWMHGR